MLLLAFGKIILLLSHRSDLLSKSLSASQAEYLNITPSHATTAQTSDAHVKTTKSFFSLQPHFSKWWWIGAILKTRLPCESLK